MSDVRPVRPVLRVAQEELVPQSGVSKKENVQGDDCNPCSLRKERDTASLRHAFPWLGATCFIAEANSVVCRHPFVASVCAVTCHVMTQHQSGLTQFHSYFRCITLRVRVPQSVVIDAVSGVTVSNPRRFADLSDFSQQLMSIITLNSGPKHIVGPLSHMSHVKCALYIKPSGIYFKERSTSTVFQLNIREKDSHDTADTEILSV